jgi:hypothetical protein
MAFVITAVVLLLPIVPWLTVATRETDRPVVGPAGGFGARPAFSNGHSQLLPLGPNLGSRLRALVQGRHGRAVGRMAKPPAADSGSERLLLRPFAFAGHVSVCEPLGRHLEIGPRAFGMAPNVTVAGLAAGIHVTVAGYVERPADSAPRWIVTQLLLG